jgi:hypothetical protein
LGRTEFRPKDYMRTFVGDDEFVQPKRNETAPRSECRFTLNALTQPRLLEMERKPACRTCGCYISQHDAKVLKTSALSACDVIACLLRSARNWMRKSQWSRPVDKRNDGYDLASGSGAPKPHFDPIEKVRESKFKDF